MDVSGINRIIADALGTIVIISIYFVGGVILSVLTSTNLIKHAALNTSMTGQITNYGTIGSIVGLVMIVLLLSDAVRTVRGMGHRDE